MKKVLILGGLGNGSIIAWAITDMINRSKIDVDFIGFINDRDNVSEIEGFPVIGGLSGINKFINDGYYFINTIYKIDGQEARIKLFNELNIPQSQLFTFIHDSSYIAPNSIISPGCVIMPNVNIDANTKLGICCRVMMGATIGHNSLIGEHTFCAYNSMVGSFTNIGEGVHIGLNATVREFLNIGRCSTLGMGSVLTKNIGIKEVWVGNPATKLRDALDDK